jgi:hypothetical protein
LVSAAARPDRQKRRDPAPFTVVIFVMQLAGLRSGAYSPVGLREEFVVIRSVALLLALAVAQPALAQTAPTAAPNPSPTSPSPTKSSPAKPAAKKPAPPKSDAGATSPAGAGAAQRGRCIGVIPHIGDHFAVQTIGVMAFGNDLKEVPIEAWGLDDLVVARVRAAAGTGIAVRRIAYAANAFEPYDHPPRRLFGDADKDLKSVVQAIAGAGGCERYIVVVKDTNGDRVTNQSFTGIGIFSRAGGDVHLFALTALSVFDGHTFEVLEKRVGSPVEEKLGSNPTLYDRLRTNPMRGANLALKEDFSWPPSQDAVMGLRDATRALLAESLDKTLPKLLAPKNADEE